MDENTEKKNFHLNHCIDYNCYSMEVRFIFTSIFLWLKMLQGKDVPTNQDPLIYCGKENKKLNISQFIPRPSEKKRKLPELYENIQSAFEEVFEWQKQVVSDFQ